MPRSTCALAVSVPAGMAVAWVGGPRAPAGGRRAIAQSRCTAAPRGSALAAWVPRASGPSRPLPTLTQPQMTGPQMRLLVGLPRHLVPPGDSVPVGLWSEPELVSASTFSEEPPWHLCP